MSETSDLLRATAERLFADHLDKTVHEAAEAGEWPAALWAAVEEAGLAGALVPEDAGGAGLDPADALAVLDVAGHARAPIPLAETMLAGHLLGRAGLNVPNGPLSLAPVAAGSITATRTGSGWRIEGSAARIPWARHAAGIVILAEAKEGQKIALVERARLQVEHGTNLAGEPRDSVTIAADLAATAVADAPVGTDGLRLLGAAARTAQIAGAIRFVLDLTIDYVNTRVQFGKPIGRFQAIQHMMAVMAEHAAAAQAAAGMAADGITGTMRLVPVAAAKARAGEAAGQAAAIAHQSHGAIGFTREYDLHRATRRLWSWRDEFGNEADWQRRLGQAAIAAGADDLWAFLTAA
jgi:acyl-CoA dehydrogenase